MAAEQPLNPRAHGVSFDISAPRKQASPQVTRTEPGNRVSQRLERLEHRVEMAEANLSMLATALTEKAES